MHKLQDKLSKCEFGLHNIEYLGHCVGCSWLCVDPSKVAAVVYWEVPMCVKHIQHFLGFANYFNRYIAKFAVIAAPLMFLLKKGMTWLWEPA